MLVLIYEYINVYSKLFGVVLYKEQGVRDMTGVSASWEQVCQRKAACVPARPKYLCTKAASSSWHVALSWSSFDPISRMLSYIDLPRYYVLH